MVRFLLCLFLDWSEEPVHNKALYWGESDRCKPCRGRRKGSTRFWDNLQKGRKNNVPNADLPRCKGDGGRIGYDVCVYISDRK